VSCKCRRRSGWSRAGHRGRSGRSLPRPPSRLSLLRLRRSGLVRLTSKRIPKDTECTPSAMLTRASLAGLDSSSLQSHTRALGDGRMVESGEGGMADRSSPSSWLRDRRPPAHLPSVFALDFELPGLGSSPAPIAGEHIAHRFINPSIDFDAFRNPERRLHDFDEPTLRWIVGQLAGNALPHRHWSSCVDHIGE
jgi:hypothetical protein